MTRLKLTFLSITLFLLTAVVNAQGKTVIGETMRSNGRIYVVVGVLAIIFIGVILYLLRLEKKMSRMEKQFEGNSSKL